MAEFEKKIHAEGHLIDSDLLSRVMDRIIREGTQFRILSLEVGSTNDEPSSIDMMVSADTAQRLGEVLQQLSDLGFTAETPVVAAFEAAPGPGVAPKDFYSTTNQTTDVFSGSGSWVTVTRQRMDACIVDRGTAGLECVKIRDLQTGDPVVVGLEGVRVTPEVTDRERSEFSFMNNEVSSERQVKLAVAQVADKIREVQSRGEKVVWVPGPVVIHTGAGVDLSALVEAGYVDGVLTGNALAVHDVEFALFETSLGVSLKDGQVIHLGHRHHMRAINAVRGAGSLQEAVAKGILTRGIFYSLVRNKIPFVLAGSIRDDGPLPDTMMDLIEAQDAYSKMLGEAGMVIVLSSMLHGIGVGNMMRGSIPLVCVDINAAVVTKLSDRGSSQTHGVVTDVGLFLHLLRAALVGDSPPGGGGE